MGGEPGVEPRPTDDVRAVQAEQALRSSADVPFWADRFALLGDVNRLRIVMALHRAPGMTVGGIADAVGMSHNAVSHALAALRVTGVLSVDRDGRYRRWSVCDPTIHEILHQVGATHSSLHPEH